MLNLKGGEESHRQKKGQSRSQQASTSQQVCLQGRQLGSRSLNKREAPTEAEEGHGGRPGLERKSSATEG